MARDGESRLDVQAGCIVARRRRICHLAVAQRLQDHNAQAASRRKGKWLLDVSHPHTCFFIWWITCFSPSAIDMFMNTDRQQSFFALQGIKRLLFVLAGVQDVFGTSAEPCDKTEKMSGIPGARRNAYSVITSPASSSTPSSTSRIAFLNPTASGGIVVPPCRCERKARQAQQSLCTGSVCNDDDVPGSRGRAPLCPHSGTRRTGGSS